jgi:uncharacterized membrane protein
MILKFAIINRIIGEHVMEQFIGILLYTLIYLGLGVLLWKAMNYISGLILALVRKLIE